MTDFLTALCDPGMTFLRYALFVGLLASIAFGIIGSYVVTRRITYLAGAIAHCVLGGIGMALYLQKVKHLAWMNPFYGAVCAALLAALIIGLVSLHAKEREDTVIGALWAIGMAIGLLFLAKTPGYVDPMSYLFGNILLLNKEDVMMVAGLDGIIILVSTVFYNKFLAVCFDDEFARMRNVSADLYYLTLLVLTALSIVLLVRVVGIVMVVAFLTLPAAIAGNFSKNLWQMMAAACLLCMFFISAGLAASYHYDLPSGPAIILLAGCAYLLVVTTKKWTRAWKNQGDNTLPP